jgi:hypothetical protein
MRISLNFDATPARDTCCFCFRPHGYETSSSVLEARLAVGSSEPVCVSCVATDNIVRLLEIQIQFWAAFSEKSPFIHFTLSAMERELADGLDIDQAARVFAEEEWMKRCVIEDIPTRMWN